MDIEKLKQKVLDLAIRGKLVPQDPNDEPASVLIEKIKKEKEELVKQGKIKPSKNDSYIYKGSDNCYYENKNGKIKNINDEIPFDIPENWEWIRLNEIGLFKKGPFGSSLTKDMFVAETTLQRKKVYEQKNAIQKNYSLGKYYISNEKFKSMESFIVEPGDIIVSCAGTIGEIYILPECAEVGVINQALMKIKLFYKQIESYFIMYFDFVLKKEANEKGNGTGMKNIPSFDILKNMLIPLPPENEINRIILKLNKIIEKIKRLDKKTTYLKKDIEQIKYKILETFFGENSTYKSYYENCSILDDIEILDNIRKPINKEERFKRLNKNTLKYPYYGATGIVGEIDDYIYNGELVLLGEDGAPFLNKYANKAYLVNGKFWVNNHAHMLKSKTNNKFLLYYLNWIDYSKYVSGTTRLKLSQHNLIKIPFISCNPKIKKEIVDKIESSVILLEKIKEQIK